MMPDVLIVGGGVIGCSIARELARYKLGIVLCEAMYDVGKMTSSANSGIIHAGYDPKPGTLMSKLNVQGNLMYDKLAEELEFEFNRCGSLLVAFNDEDLATVDRLIAQGEEAGVSGLRKLSREEALEMEPNLTQDVVGAMYHPSGVCSSYEVTAALADNCAQNGVEILVNSPVTAIVKQKNGTFEVTAGEKVLHTRYIINCAGLYSPDVSAMAGAGELIQQPRRGDYFIFDKKWGDFVKTIIFPVPGPMGKGVLIIPSPDGKLIIGPSSTDTDLRDSNYTVQEDLDFVWEHAKRCAPSLPQSDVVASFMGLRAEGKTHDFNIKPSEKVPGLLNLWGIASPGLTASPALAIYVREMLGQDMGLELVPNPGFNPKRKGIQHFIKKTWGEREALIKENPQYGRIVCRCETVTEGEIVDALKRAPRANALDAIKHRTHATMGRCQGGFCTCRLLEIISRETGLPVELITKRGSDSYIVQGKIKQFAAKGGIPV